MRQVWCIGTWPEDNYEDFPVLNIKDGETDDQAIQRAIEAYSDKENFYIKEN